MVPNTLPLLLLSASALLDAAGAQLDRIDYRSLVRDHPIGRQAIQDVEARVRGLDSTVYLEAPLHALKGYDPDNELWKLSYLRGSMDPEAVKITIDINPYVDLDVGEGEYTITESKAVVDTRRNGWMSEQSSEKGRSTAAEAKAEAGFPGIASVSFGLTHTVHGSERRTNGTNGENSKTLEDTITLNSKLVCPPDHSCMVITWTYSRTISGPCYSYPILDALAARTRWPLLPQNYGLTNLSMAFLHGALATKDINDEFFQFAESRPALQDINAPEGKAFFEQGYLQAGARMHPAPWIAQYKKRGMCTFKHTLRKKDEKGTPYRTQRTFKIRLPAGNGKPSTSSASSAPEIPKAVRMSKNKNYCRLENGWKYSTKYGMKSYRRPEGEWEEHPDWPEPQDADVNCAEMKRVGASANQVPVRRGLGQLNTSTALDFDKIEVEEGYDDIKDYLRLAKEQGYDGLSDPV